MPVDSPDTTAERDDFDIWEQMKGYSFKVLYGELDSPNESRRFAAAKELQLRGGKTTFNYAVTLTKSERSQSREISAFLLGQLGTPERPFAESTMPLLVDLLAKDTAPNVRAAAAAAIGYLGLADGFSAIENALSDGDVSVREYAAFALGRLHDLRAVERLLQLTFDNNPEVVYWAVVGLGNLGANSEHVRERFSAMLANPVHDIQDELIVCLCQWGDTRVLPFLVNELSKQDVNLEIILAAGRLGDTSLLPRLYELRDAWDPDQPKSLITAINMLEKI